MNWELSVDTKNGKSKNSAEASATSIIFFAKTYKPFNHVDFFWRFNLSLLPDRQSFFGLLQNDTVCSNVAAYKAYLWNGTQNM